MDDGLFNEDGYRKYIFFVLLIVVLIFIICIFVFNRKTDYLIINESTVFTKKGSKLKQVDYVKDKMLEGDFNVFSDGKKYKNVTIKYDSLVWYYFDEDYKDLGLTKVSAAYSKGFKGLKVADYDVSYYEESDNDIIKSIFGDKDISGIENSVIKSSFDLDGDGIVETIYTLNKYDLDLDLDELSSYIFIVKNDELMGIIKKNINDTYLVQNIIDIDNDGNYEILFSEGTNDVVTLDTCINVYSVSKKKFLLNCK